jgi:hypothetical protein
MEVAPISLKKLLVKQLYRVSPSRYTAMKECLLREVWTASGNKPLLPLSPLAELGSVIHQLLEAAGSNQLDDGGKASVETIWDGLISKVERKMMLSPLSKHFVPLSKNVPDFEVRKLRACHRAAEITHDAVRNIKYQAKQSPEQTGFELWVENDTGEVGGYIDYVMMTEDGLVLRDYKSGAVLDSRTGGGLGQIKQAYKMQLLLYAALYHNKYGMWPVRLEVVPLQGTPVNVVFDPEEAEHLLREASAFLRTANQRVAQVEKGNSEAADLATPRANHCGFCLFRPACQVYWTARKQEPEEKWPADVQGFLRKTTYLRNGKMCMRIVEDDSFTSSIATVRNLTDCVHRHPLLHRIGIGGKVAIYSLEYNYHSGDYRETQNTVIYRIN